ncbi:hypothetical protein [Rossellomorea marisflavi]|uniref:hypothetical protein n=1 Tax=Rossellomorea marisflavi TaxID=189381 RepID=UPI00397A065F
MNKNGVLALLLVITMSLLSGCLYPEENKSQNKIPYDAQVKSVQEAVDTYQKDTGGLLPIKTKEEDTPIYQKYPLDFKKLVPQYLNEVPGNAFESGGIFQYVIIDAEEDPEVKIFDLRMAERIREVNIRIQAQDYPPFEKQVAENVYKLNYKELGYDDEVYVQSPYTNHNLPLVINGDGEIFVDYSMDLYDKVKDRNDVKEGEDIRRLLTEDSLFVPAYSLPYTIDDKNEPVFMTK